MDSGLPPQRRSRGAAPPLLRARRRRVARLPRSGRVRGSRAVHRAQRRHRASEARLPHPGPLATRGLRAASEALPGDSLLPRPVRGAAQEQAELHRVRGATRPRRRGARPAAQEDRQPGEEGPRRLQARLQ